MLYFDCIPGDLLICKRTGCPPNLFKKSICFKKKDFYIFLDYDPYDETVSLLETKSNKKITLNTIDLEACMKLHIIE